MTYSYVVYNSIVKLKNEALLKMVMTLFTMIETDARLRGLVEELMQKKEIAVDLEMEANFHHYGVHLSLVQISDGSQAYIIDYLCITDPLPLKLLFENPHVMKVFHDVSFDFRILEEVLDCRPKNIFDTKVAAELCGRTSVSLGALLMEEFGLEKDTKSQKADWLQRPLNKRMLTYAARDVTNLLQLKARLIAELLRKGRMQWCDEELSLIAKTSYAVATPTCQDVKGSKSLDDLSRGRLCAMYPIREAIAQKINKPVFFVINDKLLLEMAKKPPVLKEWFELKGVHPAVRRSAKQFFTAAKNARPVKKEYGDPKQRLTQEQIAFIDDMGKKRDKVAEILGITPHLVITREQMVCLSQKRGDACLKEWQKKVLALHS